MAFSHAEGCAWNEAYILQVCRGWVCNTLVEDPWSDRTPLHDAALRGQLLPIKTLLSQGMNVGVVTLDGITPLHEACLGGHFASAKLLLEHGADARGREPMAHEPDVALLMTVSGSQINQAKAVSVDGITPLFYACFSGNVTLLHLLLKNISVHHPAHLRSSPLHIAAKRGHTACVEVLLSYGMDADMELDDVGTPLYCACESQKTECAQKLLISGADVQRGRGLDSPLHAAVRVGGAKEVALLLEHGADRRCRNSEGKTPLDLSTDHSIRALLQTAGPWSLSQLGRLCIRRSLGQKGLNKVEVLNLPQILQSYILYE